VNKIRPYSGPEYLAMQDSGKIKKKMKRIDKE